MQTLIEKAERIMQDCNQTESSREVIAELVAALRVEPDADVTELITTGREYVRQVAGEAAYLWSNQMTALCDALASEHAERKRVQQLYDAGKAQWNPVYEIVLNDRDELRQRITTLQAALSAAQWLLVNAETHFRPDVSLPVRQDFKEAAARALAILTPTPNVAEKGLEQRVGVSE